MNNLVKKLSTGFYSIARSFHLASLSEYKQDQPASAGGSGKGYMYLSILHWKAVVVCAWSDSSAWRAGDTIGPLSTAPDRVCYVLAAPDLPQ